MSFRSGCSSTLGALFAIFIVVPLMAATLLMAFGYYAIEKQHAELLLRREAEQALWPQTVDPQPFPVADEKS